MARGPATSAPLAVRGGPHGSPGAATGAAITGVAMALPARLVPNREIAALLGVEESWITKRTGTGERPWAAPDERLSEFAARAGREALSRAGVAAHDLDLVIVATSTADDITPNAAPVVAGLVGADQAGAFDIGSACTGWLAGLATACGQIESGRARHALVVGADFLSRFLELSDRETTPLFADGAAAAIVSARVEADGRVGPLVLQTDAGGADLIRLERAGRIQMRGQDTFRAAVKSLADVTLQALELADLTIEDIDLFVYHQANSRIIRAVGQRLALPPERVVDYVERYANASAATLPIALSVAEREGRLRPGDRVLMAAFGGGFTWGATTVQWCRTATR
ncbi:MAG: beta-ketoacyl-ACP synthase 3 [Solirubrobacterales bacterium]|nr:beta-ketoacyl-ACP synthase 3 [Solirubrobacterales bacterium]MBV9799274.1 beta-ketoacyl-ACP synthase 3 [Solirubrobacterales bacterium]